MSIKRITISVPSALAAKVKRAAGKKPVSVFVADVLEASIEEEQVERAWREYVADVAPTAADDRRADDVIAGLRRRKRRRAA
jgi:metal-responsive CopG/Arc/MetJ family transcriptional regulator